MKVKFFKDNFNGRFTWGWVDGEYVTEDSAEIENYIALGIRHEEVRVIQKPVQPPTHEGVKGAVKRTRKKKKD